MTKTIDIVQYAVVNKENGEVLAIGFPDKETAERARQYTVQYPSHFEIVELRGSLKVRQKLWVNLYWNEREMKITAGTVHSSSLLAGEVADSRVVATVEVEV